MGFKKIMNSESAYVVGDFIDESIKNQFQPGFEYRIGRTVYTVREDVTKDSGSPMRRVTTSDGGTEILTIESIRKDLLEPDAQIIHDPSKVAPKTEKKVKKNGKK